MKKAFTLIELLVCICAVGVLCTLFFGSIHGCQSFDWSDEAYYNPDAARVHEARNQVEQLRIQNELKMKELELLERNLK